jgi:hypothetical protein
MIGLEGRGPVVVRVGRDGQVRALERSRDGVVLTTPLGLPLIERVPDPAIEFAYLGDRQEGLRLCSLLRLHLGVSDLSDTLVIVVPDAPLDALMHALVGGLQRDAERCLADQQGIAVIVDPRAAEVARPEPEGAAP